MQLMIKAIYEVAHFASTKYVLGQNMISCCGVYDDTVIVPNATYAHQIVPTEDVKLRGAGLPSNCHPYSVAFTCVKAMMRSLAFALVRDPTPFGAFLHSYHTLNHDPILARFHPGAAYLTQSGATTTRPDEELWRTIMGRAGCYMFIFLPASQALNSPRLHNEEWRNYDDFDQTLYSELHEMIIHRHCQSV